MCTAESIVANPRSIPSPAGKELPAPVDRGPDGHPGGGDLGLARRRALRRRPPDRDGTDASAVRVVPVVGGAEREDPTEAASGGLRDDARLVADAEGRLEQGVGGGGAGIGWADR